MTCLHPVILSVAGLLAILRLWGVKAQWFQAAAHLFVGGLIVAAVLDWDVNGPLWAGTVVVLSVVELGRFLWDRFHKPKTE